MEVEGQEVRFVQVVLGRIDQVEGVDPEMVVQTKVGVVVVEELAVELHDWEQEVSVESEGRVFW